MLLHFSVSNFRAFRGLQSLNLTASNTDKSLPHNLIEPDLPGLKNKRWVTAAGVYGANASGKSTLLEALGALTSLVRESAKTTDPHAPIKQIEPFALDTEAANEPTAFAIVFVSQGIRYEYRVAATTKHIVHESLRSFPKGSERMWFTRDWSDEKAKHIFGPQSPAGLKRSPEIEVRTLDNMLYLSKGIAEARKELEPVYRWLVEYLVFLNLGKEHGLGFEKTMSLIESGSPEERQAILNILKHADLGILDAGSVKVGFQDAYEYFEQLSDEMKKEFRTLRTKNPELTHQGKNDQIHPLAWNRESVGTQRFYALLGPWLDILKNGYTVCIDELETSMHPIMVRELLKLFFNKETNPKRAQILFTTHNPLLLDTTLIRRDQIWLTDKDATGEGHLYSLLDYKPRSGESLVRGYMAGRYGAVPFIPDGLLGTEGLTES